MDEYEENEAPEREGSSSEPEGPEREESPREPETREPEEPTRESEPEEPSPEPEEGPNEPEEPSPEPEAPEEGPREPEEPSPEPEAPGEGPRGPREPEEPSLEPEAPGEGPSEPEEPPSEEAGADSDTMQDLIDAIGDLNETITGVVTQEPEGPSTEEEGSGGGGGFGGEVFVEESASVDLTPVVTVLERNEKLLIHINELLEQQAETQHNDFLQLQANVDFVFLAVAALIGVVLGVAVGKVFHDLWRA